MSRNHVMSVREQVKKKILTEHIEIGFERDVKNGIRDRNCYSAAGKAFETLSKIFIAFGGILSFSSGYFSNPHLSFAAGSVSTVSLAFLQFSTFCYKESMKNQENVNTILRDLNIQSLPQQTFLTVDSKESHPLPPIEEKNIHEVRVHVEEEDE